MDTATWTIDKLDAERERLDRQADHLLREQAALAGSDPNREEYRNHVARLNEHKAQLSSYLWARFRETDLFRPTVSPRMPDTECPRCGRAGFVCKEQVVAANAAWQFLDCDACDYSWEFGTAGQPAVAPQTVATLPPARRIRLR